jgi:protein TonB
MQQEKPAPAATAQATQPAAHAKAAERPAKDAKPAEPARPSAAATKWQAAAPAPAKEPAEKKAVAAATAAAPAAVTPTRMKFCDKCGSTYPAQFNVCPIDTAPLRFADEPAAATTSPVVEKTAVAAATAAVVAQASSKSRAAEKAAEKPRESAKVEVSEIRAQLRPHEDEARAAGEHKADDWQTLLRDKNWAALAANPVVLAAATLILILLVGGIVWKVRRSHNTNDSVKAMEKAPEQPAANGQPGLVTNSIAQPVSASATTTVKPPDQNANKQNAQLGKEAQPKPDNPSQNAPKPAEVLSVPTQAPREVATAKRPEVSNDPIEPPSSIPGALPNTSPNNLGAIAKDVPVAVPTLDQQKLRVSSGVAQAQLTHKVNPQYPPEAFQSRVHGTVVLQAVIGKDGGVKTVKVVSGPPMLVKSATEAVKQWRYKPFTLNGEAVEADTQINVNFSME